MICPIDIKALSEKIVYTLSKLIFVSVRSGKYPRELKEGVVRPIFKIFIFASFGDVKK